MCACVCTIWLAYHHWCPLGLEVVQEESSHGPHLSSTAAVMDFALYLLYHPGRRDRGGVLRLYDQPQQPSQSHPKELVETCADFKGPYPLAGPHKAGFLVPRIHQGLLDLGVCGRGLVGVPLVGKPGP